MSAPPRLFAVLACAGLLAGCPVKPPPSPAEIREQAPAVPELELEQPWRAAEGSPAVVEDDWLATFGDARLDSLVAEAVANNADLRVASVRVEQASAYVRLAQAALRPQVGFFGLGGANVSGGDPSSALQGATLGVSWEPDLWGRLRYARNATQESEAAIRSDFEFARQSLAATVAKTWFTAAMIGLQRQHTQAMVVAAEELVRLGEQRLRVGIGDEQEVTATRARLGDLRDLVLELSYQESQSLRALELLLGRYPATELVARDDLPALPGPVPIGLPLQLLERRPDLVAAERRVAAAFNRIGEAKAARLPRLALNASVSAISSDVLALKPDFENPSFGVGAKLLAPIYQGGALKTQVEIRTLEQKEALADYARLALRALGDVEEALASGGNLEAREAQLEEIVTHNERALDLANREYSVGKGDLRAVRTQELAVADSRIDLLAVRGAQLAERINLHLALGGSFEPPPPEPEPASEAEAVGGT